MISGPAQTYILHQNTMVTLFLLTKSSFYATSIVSSIIQNMFTIRSLSRQSYYIHIQLYKFIASVHDHLVEYGNDLGAI